MCPKEIWIQILTYSSIVDAYVLRTVARRFLTLPTPQAIYNLLAKYHHDPKLCRIFCFEHQTNLCVNLTRPFTLIPFLQSIGFAQQKLDYTKFPYREMVFLAFLRSEEWFDDDWYQFRFEVCIGDPRILRLFLHTVFAFINGYTITLPISKNAYSITKSSVRLTRAEKTKRLNIFLRWCLPTALNLFHDNGEHGDFSDCQHCMRDLSHAINIALESAEVIATQCPFPEHICSCQHCRTRLCENQNFLFE